MRKTTVRRGLRCITLGMLCVLTVTFFHDELSRVFFLGFGGEAHVTFLGFFLGGIFGGCGVLVAAAGMLLPGRAGEARVRLAPSILLLFGVIFLFFFLVYNSFSVPRTPQLPPGESITI